MEKNIKKNAILCALYIFFNTCCMSSYVSIFGYLPEYLGIDLVATSAGTSINSAGMIFGSFIAAILFRKLGPKLCMVLSGLSMLGYAMLLSFVPGMYTFYAAFAIAGLIMGIGNMTCVTDMLVKLGAGKYITFCLGVNMVATGACQSLAGVIFGSMGIREVFLLEVAISAVFSAVVALALPNVKAKENNVIQPVADEEQVNAPKKGGSVYANPAVWVFWIASALIGGILQVCLMYATVYFPSFGNMSVTAAANLLSILGLAAGGFNMFLSGKVIEKIGIKKFAFTALGCVVAVNALGLFYGTMPQMWVIVLLVLFYAVGFTAFYLYTLVPPMIFSADVSTEVMTKGNAFMGIGNVCYPLLWSSVITNAGFATAYSLSIGIAVICLLAYVLFFGMLKKKSA